MVDYGMTFDNDLALELGPGSTFTLPRAIVTITPDDDLTVSFRHCINFACTRYSTATAKHTSAGAVQHLVRAGAEQRSTLPRSQS